MLQQIRDWLKKEKSSGRMHQSNDWHKRTPQTVGKYERTCCNTSKVSYSNDEDTITISIIESSLSVSVNGEEIGRELTTDGAFWVANEYMRHGNKETPDGIPKRHLEDAFSA